MSSVILFHLSNLDDLPTLLQQVLHHPLLTVHVGCQPPQSSQRLRGFGCNSSTRGAEPGSHEQKGGKICLCIQEAILPRLSSLPSHLFLFLFFFFLFMRFGNKSHKISTLQICGICLLFLSLPLNSHYSILRFAAFQILPNQLLIWPLLQGNLKYSATSAVLQFNH